MDEFIEKEFLRIPPDILKRMEGECDDMTLDSVDAVFYIFDHLKHLVVPLIHDSDFGDDYAGAQTVLEYIAFFTALRTSPERRAALYHDLERLLSEEVRENIEERLKKMYYPIDKPVSGEEQSPEEAYRELYRAAFGMLMTPENRDISKIFTALSAHILREKSDECGAYCEQARTCTDPFELLLETTLFCGRRNIEIDIVAVLMRAGLIENAN